MGYWRSDVSKSYNVNLYAMKLQMMEVSARSHTLESVLRSLDESLRTVCDELNSLDEQDLLPEHQEALLDDGIDYIESLLGAAFVTCQAEVSQVVSQVKWMHEYLSKRGEQPLTCCGPDKKDILTLDSPQFGASGYSEIQVIDAAANYFKHNSEWSHDWSRLVGKQRKTADILESVGVESGKTGAIRTLAEVLDNKEYSETRRFAVMVSGWHANVVATVRRELAGRGLVMPK